MPDDKKKKKKPAKAATDPNLMSVLQGTGEAPSKGAGGQYAGPETGIAADLAALKNVDNPEEYPLPDAEDYRNMFSLRGFTVPSKQGDKPTVGDMLNSVDDDTGPRQNLASLGPKEWHSMLAQQNAQEVAEAMDTDLGKKGLKYQDLGMIITMIGAMTGMPSLAVSGLLLRNKGSGIINSLIGPINEATARMASEYGEYTKKGRLSGIEMSPMQKAVKDYSNRYALAKTDEERATIEEQAKTYLSGTFGLMGDQLNAQITFIKGGTGDLDEELIRKSGEATESVTEAKTRKAIQIGQKDPDSDLAPNVTGAIERLDRGDFTGAASAYITDQVPTQEATGKTTEDILLESFALDAPIPIFSASEMDERVKMYQRTPAVDAALKEFFGKEPTREDVLVQGEIDDLDVDKFYPLKFADRNAPVIKQANQVLWWMINNGAFVKDDGGWVFRAPTELRDTTLPPGIPSMYAFPTEKSKLGGWTRMVDKTWRGGSRPTKDQLFAALDADGLSAELMEILRLRIPLLR